MTSTYFFHQDAKGIIKVELVGHIHALAAGLGLPGVAVPHFADAMLTAITNSPGSFNVPIDSIEELSTVFIYNRKERNFMRFGGRDGKGEIKRIIAGG